MYKKTIAWTIINSRIIARFNIFAYINSTAQKSKSEY